LIWILDFGFWIVDWDFQASFEPEEIQNPQSKIQNPE